MEQGMEKTELADVSFVKNKYLDIPYAGDSVHQKMDLYLPESGKGPFRVMVYIHGGGFALGDKRDDHVLTYLELLKDEIAICSVEYRLSGEAVFPAAVLDCRTAVRYLRAHAAEYQIDPEHIGAIGGSAGGNLSALLAMNVPNGEFFGEEGMHFQTACTVCTAVDQFGPTDFRTMDEMAGRNEISLQNHDAEDSPESRYLGGAVQELDPEYVRKADPAQYISEKMAPILVQHGLMDRLVPYGQSEYLVKEIRKKSGNRSMTEFTTLPTADHDDPLYAAPENMQIVRDFLHRTL